LTFGSWLDVGHARWCARLRNAEAGLIPPVVFDQTGRTCGKGGAIVEPSQTKAKKKR